MTKTFSIVPWRLLQRLADSDLLSFLLAAAAASDSTVAEVSVQAGYVFQAILMYALLPRVTSGWVGQLVRRRVVRLAIVGTVVGLVSGSITSPERIIVVSLLGVTYPAVLYLSSMNPLRVPDGAIYQLTVEILPERQATEVAEVTDERLELSTFKRRRERLFWLLLLVVAGFIVQMGALLVGAVLLAVNLFSPLLETAVLVVLIRRRLNRYRDDSEAQSFDIERSLVAAATLFGQSVTVGISTAVLLLISVAISATPIVLFRLIVFVSETSVLAGPRPAVLGMLLLMFCITGGYGLWYWYRIAREIPVVAGWFSGEGSVSTATVERPAWLTLPLFLSLTVWSITSVTQALYLHNHQTDLLPMTMVVNQFLLYALCVGVLLFAVWQTRKRSPQTARSRRWEFPVAAAVHGLGFTFAAATTLQYDRIVRNGFPTTTTWITDPIAMWATLYGFLFGLLYLDPVQSMAQRATPLRRLTTLVCYWSGFVVASWALVRWWIGSFASIAAGVAGVLTLVVLAETVSESTS